MTNIEIKAHYPDVERAAENLNALGAGLAGTFYQKDTYFNLDQGRLKLRELSLDEGHLIFYQREDLAGPKRSDYEIAKTEDTEGQGNNVSGIHGVWVEVEKTRQVWLWENVRIHLDDVKGIGPFVELEAVTEEKGIEESHHRVEALMRALEITSDQLVKGSYGDIVAAS